jgi:hypothetical protein
MGAFKDILIFINENLYFFSLLTIGLILNQKINLFLKKYEDR